MTPSSLKPTSALAALSGLTLPRGLNFEEPAGGGTGVANPPASGGGQAGAAPAKVVVNIDKSFIDKLVGDNKDRGVDMNAKVKVGDKEMTVGELAATAQQAGSLQAQVTEFGNLKTALAAVHAPADKFDVNAARTGMETTLRVAGLSEDAIKAELAEMFPEAPANGAGGGGNNGAGGGQRPDPMAGYRANANERLAQDIEQNASTEFRGHSVIKPIIEAKTKLMETEVKALMAEGKAEEAKALKAEHDTFVSEWEAQAAQELNNRLSKRLKDAVRANPNAVFSIKWIKEEAKQAADMIAPKLRRATGDARYIGKTPATAAESSFSVLDQKPVERPKIEPGKTNISDLERQQDAFGTDFLLRAAARSRLAEGAGQI